VSSAQTAIGTIQNLINSIMAPINALTGAANNIAGGIGGFATTAIKAFASGGIVTSPQLALVGEAGPEAIIPLSAFSGGSSLAGTGAGGGSGNIVININGGQFLNQGGAQQIAQALATMIGRQLKLSTI
jgi:phage-related minor tail protein